MVEKAIKTLLVLLVMTVSVFSQTDWTGEYFYGEDGGETAGGTKIYIAHTIKVTKKGGKITAHIYSQGFQTSRDIIADVEIEGSTMKLLFRDRGPDHVMGDFERGDVLLSLKSTNRALLTDWGAFEPSLDANSDDGAVRFKRLPVWKSLSAADNQISFDLPENLTQIRHSVPFVVFRQIGMEGITVKEAQFLGGALDNAVFRTEVFSTEEPLKLSKALQANTFEGTVKIAKKAIGEYQFTSVFKEYPDFERQTWYISGNKLLFVFTAAARSNTRTVFERFFNSITLAGGSSDNRIRLIWKPSQNDGLTASSTNRPEKRALQIVHKFRPSYTKQARNENRNGSVVLKITLPASGLVRDVTVIDSVSDDLDNQALAAAYMLIYFPEIRRGRVVGMRKSFNYKFSIY